MAAKTSSHRPWFSPPEPIIEHNRRLGEYLEDRFHMSLLTYKTIKWLTFLAAMGVAAMAINEGADPLFVIIVVGLILGAPDILEYIAVRDDFQEFREMQEDDDEDLPDD